MDEKWQGCVRNRMIKAEQEKIKRRRWLERGRGAEKETQEPHENQSSRQNTHTSSEGTGEVERWHCTALHCTALTHRCLRLTRRRRLFLRVGVGVGLSRPHLTSPYPREQAFSTAVFATQTQVALPPWESRCGNQLPPSRGDSKKIPVAVVTRTHPFEFLSHARHPRVRKHHPPHQRRPGVFLR